MIPEKYDRRPIGRQIQKQLRGESRESGVVFEAENLHANPKCIWTYKVRWTSSDGPNVTYVETLALRTLLTYFSEEDTYVDEPWVGEDIRVLQKVCSLWFGIPCSQVVQASKLVAVA